MIYADNAATSLLDRDAYEAMIPYLLDLYGNASQPYSFSRDTKKALREARKMIAECINAEPGEIFFTSGGTESNNWAIKGLLQGELKSAGVITSAIEHHSVLNPCATLEKLGHSVKYAKVDSKGMVNVKALEESIEKSDKLVSIMMANNEIGTVQEIKELSSIAHKHNKIFHTDAVQALGHIKVDVKELDVDLLSASAHKFNGPKGIGFLYIRDGISIAPLIEGGNQEFGFRSGTENVASIVGMAIALKNNVGCIDEHQKYIWELEKSFLSELNSLGLDYVRNGSGRGVPGNLSLSFRNADGEMLLHRLDLLGILVSTGSACNGSMSEVSHVLKAIGVAKEYAEGTIRVSLNHLNTKDEVIAIANAIKKILG